MTLGVVRTASGVRNCVGRHSMIKCVQAFLSNRLLLILVVDILYMSLRPTITGVDIRRIMDVIIERAILDANIRCIIEHRDR